MDRGENQKLVLHKNCVYGVYSRDKNHTDLFKKFQFLQAHYNYKYITVHQNYNWGIQTKVLYTSTW